MKKEILIYMNMKCSIIIITYNAREYTEICLNRLLKEPLPDDFELILIDNNSIDGVTDVVKSFEGKKNVRIFLKKENLGFAGGNNEAVNQANGEYVFLLNPDTEIDILEIKKLTNFLDFNKKVGVVGPRIYDSAGLVQESHGSSMTIASEFLGKIFGSIYIQNFPIIKKIRMSHFNKKGPTKVGWIGGAAFMARKELYEKAGGIDPHFFYSAGDMVDLCGTIKELGFDSVFFPDAVMTHKGGVSAIKDKVSAICQSHEGSLYYFKKHHGIFGYFLMKIIYTIISLVKGLVALLVSIFKGKYFLSVAKSHFVVAYRMIIGKL